jgi:hypothetical protein
MMLEGRRATWPKIERIRNTTQISRTIDGCLQRTSGPKGAHSPCSAKMRRKTATISDSPITPFPAD